MTARPQPRSTGADRGSPRVRATIRDVARAAGVGVSTVSKVLNHSQGSAEVQERVHEAARQLHYTPSASASALRRGSSRMIGMLVPDLANPVYVQLLRGVEAVADGRGYFVHVADGQGSARVQQAVLERFVEQGVDGVVLAGPVAGASVRALQERGIPVIPEPGEPGRRYRQAWTESERRATATMVERLIELGHLHLLWVMPPVEVRVTRHYQAGRFGTIVEAVERAGGTVGVVELPIEAPAEERAALLVAALGPATAIVCANHVVVPATLEALAERGISIPDAVSFVTYGDSVWARAFRPSLSVIAHDSEGEGASLALALIDRLDARDPLPREAPVSTFTERASVARCP